MQEEWKDIEGYEGVYQVSNLGRVKSLNYNRTNKEKILKPFNVGNGYLQVKLSKKGKCKSYLVHRLVAFAFIPNSLNLPQINHIDENKENNSIDNLEWCDSKYNINYGSHTEKVSKSLNKPVIGINKINDYICEFPSINEAERVLGVNQGHICECCKGKRKSAGGYRWYYANKEADENE